MLFVGEKNGFEQAGNDMRTYNTRQEGSNSSWARGSHALRTSRERQSVSSSKKKTRLGYPERGEYVIDQNRPARKAHANEAFRPSLGVVVVQCFVVQYNTEGFPDPQA